MSQKIIITLTDKANGKVGVNLDFDPPIKAADPATPALNLAMTMIEAVSGECECQSAEVGA